MARVDFGACVLLLADGGLLRATVRGRLMGPRKALGNAVVVGDLACFESGASAEAEATAAVTSIETRRNWFSRRAPGKHVVEQVVAANLDQVVVVGSLAEPPFRAGLTDRVLCQAEQAGVAARIVLNKCDLEAGGGEESALRILGDYERAGYPGHAVSAKSGAGLEALRAACLGKRSLFVGHSGVGKSTLLNALEPGLDLLAGRVNAKTGKGRHTTTAALLLRPEPGLELVDTPGVRAFGLWGIDPSALGRLYPEMREWIDACRFRDCEHEAEPGCAVREAVESGRVSRRRYDSMRKLRQELREEAAGESTRAGRTGG